MVAETLKAVFVVLVVVIAIAIWPFLLAKESSFQARQETTQQTAMLLEEIEAHRRTDQELQKAKEIAEARSLAKSKYVRGISHELRTPLNAVLGYAQLLEGNPAITGSSKRGIQVIRRSGAHLSNLVDGLLDISMIEAGRLQIHRDEIVLDDFLNQLVDMLRLQAQDRGLEFTFQRPPHLPAIVRTDEKRLQQILINLLQNALRFTRAGRVSLRLTYASEVAKFEVEDTGIGIAPEDLERIFRPFERLEGAERLAKGGTGLGLTITKLLAEAMGGELTVRSEPGKGSCFTVRLLLASVPQPVRTPAPQRRQPTGYTGPRRTILVADDDPDHIGVVRESLTPLGFIVLTEESGIGCVEAARQHDIDAVLLDISMPGLDGWEVARQLRETEGYEGAIVMISADARLDTQGPGHRHHDAYLIKPLQISALHDSLQGLLGFEWTYDQGESRAGPAASSPPSPARLRQLRETAERGHVKGLLDALDAIGAEQPETSPAIARLRRLAEDCDLDAFRDVVDELAAHAG
jgi:signal transduction histidine kinase/DNA-binding NarL/FixJ family response regulator